MLPIKELDGDGLEPNGGISNKKTRILKEPWLAKMRQNPSAD